MKEFTREEVAKHNTKGDAWIIIDDIVYDVSRFAPMHPGGELLLLQYCGEDGTEDFYSMHKKSVLDKYGPKFQIGVVKGGYGRVAEDGLTEFGRISDVPYAEAGYWRGFKSPYYTEKHEQFRLYVREFYDKHVREIAIQSEQSGKAVTKDLLKKLSQAGLLHTQIGPGKHLKLFEGKIPMPMGLKPEEFDYTYECILHEEASRLQAPGFVDGMYSGITIGCPVFVNYGTEAMMEPLEQIFKGEKRVCLAITEPFVGSDVANLRTTATKTPDGKYYIVNGAKKWITNGYDADYFVTAVRTGGKGAGGVSMLLIERSEGVETQLIKTSYSHTAGTAYVTFENVKVPVENLMYKENRGFVAVMANFNHERLVIAQCVIAATRYIVEECFKWSNQRNVFGKALIQQPVIREKLGKMVAQVECVHAYMEVINHQMNNMSYMEQTIQLGGPISLLKYQATRTAHNVADEAVQIFGGRGVSKGGMGRCIEIFQRTYKIPSVYGGSEEIMLDLGIKQAMKLYPDSAKL